MPSGELPANLAEISSQMQNKVINTTLLKLAYLVEDITSKLRPKPGFSRRQENNGF